MSDPVPISDATKIRDALDHPEPAPVLAQPGDAGAETKQYERPPFPSGCPIRPLGISSNLDGSQKCYYLDINRQLVGLEAGNRHGKNSLYALFGEQSDWLEAEYPQWSKPIYEGRGKDRELIKASEIVGFDQSDASRALIEECTRRGIFTAAGKMRGTGAHRQRDGGLVVHFGDKMIVSEHRVDGSFRGWKWIDPGLHEGHVYPGGAVLPRPAIEESGVAPGIELLQLVGTWNWKRSLLDKILFLGGVGASLIGGALIWRPNLWVTGGKGTGKSTLNGKNGVLHQLLGDGMFRTGNASAAAIRQSLMNSTVPVLFDEIEASADNRRVKEVIELARIASSGDTIHRGGQDHKAAEFTLQSCFWFSSINIPPLEPQDRSRMGILELRPFAPGAVAPDLASHHLPQMGRALLRRMIDAWPVLDAVKRAYHVALAAKGHDNRACDQFGTLLACAHVLLNDVSLSAGELPHDELVIAWVDRCAPERMAEISEATPDHTACMIHLTTAQVQARGGDERVQLSTWIGDAVASKTDPLFDAGVPGEQPGTADRAGERLQQYGLKLVNAVYHPEERDRADKVTKAARWGTSSFETNRPIFLAVAGQHQALAKLFEGRTWQNGVWRQSLERTPGSIDGAKVKFGRASLTAVLVPLSEVLDESELPEASRPEAREAWLLEQLSGDTM